MKEYKLYTSSHVFFHRFNSFISHWHAVRQSKNREQHRKKNDKKTKKIKRLLKVKKEDERKKAKSENQYSNVEVITIIFNTK